MHSKFKMQGLQSAEGQYKFISRYLDKLCIICENKLEALNLYKTLNWSLTRPIDLYLFCYLSIQGKVTSDTREGQLIREAVKLSMANMNKRLENKKLPNHHLLAKEMMNAMFKIAFHCFLGDELSLTNSKYEELEQSLYQINRNVDSVEIMSCVFSTAMEGGKNFEFYHKSHQEYFVAKHILNLLKGREIIDSKRVTNNYQAETPQDLLSSLCDETEMDYKR